MKVQLPPTQGYKAFRQKNQTLSKGILSFKTSLKIRLQDFGSRISLLFEAYGIIGSVQSKRAT